MRDSQRWRWAVATVALLLSASHAAADPLIPLLNGAPGPSSDSTPAPKPADWIVRVYTVDDLLTEDGADDQLLDLVQAVTNFVEPVSWDDRGGQANAAVARLPRVRAIVVRQTPAGHRRVADLLARIRQAVRPKDAKAPEKETPEQRVAKALAGPVDFSFREAPLDQVVLILGRRHGVKIELDRKAFRELNISPELPVTLRLSGVSLRSALSIIADRERLVYAAAGDKVVITTREAAESLDRPDPLLVSRVYRVGDLASLGATDSSDGLSLLEELVTSLCSPTCWDDVGGLGYLVTLPVGGSELLLVLQTGAVQDQVADLLAGLRRAVKAAGEGEIDEPFSVDDSPSKARRHVREALARPISLDFFETTLEDVASQLGKKAGINVLVDREALADVGIGVDTPVYFRVSGISLRSALNLMLRPLDLTYVLQDECLWITTPEEAESRLATVLLVVPDLVTFPDARGKKTRDFKPLIAMLTAAVKPTSWDCVGGPGSIAGCTLGDAPLLVIFQTRDAIDEIAGVVRALRHVARRQAAGETPGVVMLDEALATPAEKAIRAALDKKFSFKFIEVPLQDVADEMGEKAGINILIDRRAMDDVGIGNDSPITKSLPDLTLRQALRLLLRELDMTFVIQDEVLLITTPEEAESRLDVGLYPVRDLAGVRDASGGTRYEYDPVVELVKRTDYLSTWDDFGGAGSIDVAPFENVHALVVCQTPDVHEEIAALLGALREVAKCSARDPDFVIKRPVFHFRGNGPPGSKAIRRALDSRISLDYKEVPLWDVVKDLKKRCKIEIQIDRRALDDVGIGTDTPVSIQMKQVSLRSALRWLLRPLDLTFVVADEVLLITTPEVAQSRFKTRLYPIGDLLADRKSESEVRYEKGPLGALIARTIQPTQWDDFGGPGTIGTFSRPGVRVLVISQNDQTHDRILRLLTDLREVRAGETPGAACNPPKP